MQCNLMELIFWQLTTAPSAQGTNLNSHLSTSILWGVALVKQWYCFSLQMLSHIFWIRKFRFSPRCRYDSSVYGCWNKCTGPCGHNVSIKAAIIALFHQQQQKGCKGWWRGPFLIPHDSLALSQTKGQFYPLPLCCMIVVCTLLHTNSPTPNTKAIIKHLETNTFTNL